MGPANELLKSRLPSFKKGKKKKKSHLPGLFCTHKLHNMYKKNKKPKTQKAEDRNKLELYGFWSSSGAMHKSEVVR